MDNKQVKLRLKKQLYLKNIEQSEEFIKRIRGFIKSEYERKNKIPDSMLLANMITDILKDIRENDKEKIKHKVLKENKHECFKYYFEELKELVDLEWGSHKIQKYLNNKKKCKAPARATIDKFIVSLNNG